MSISKAGLVLFCLLGAASLVACVGKTEVGPNPSPAVAQPGEAVSEAGAPNDAEPSSPAQPSATTHYVEGEAARRRPDADVLYVRAIQQTETLWRFEVTLAHPDKGPSDYMDGWDVLLPDGSRLGDDENEAYTQSISEPSVGRQPLELRLEALHVPTDAAAVVVRAHDSRAGFGGREVTVNLDQSKGPGFEVSRSY